jgi:hypothetical protein
MDEGRYRVLPGPDAGTVCFLDRDGYEPVAVPTADQEVPVADLRPGYLVEAALDWTDPEPAVRSLSVRRPTLFAFADGADPMFEVAEETWQETRAAGEGMGSRVTHNTDGVVNGVVYVFAEDEVGGRFAEFRDGTRPLEPLLDRVNEDDPAPREAFVLRPPSREFVAVTITLRKGGQFADTVRDTYDCPRPDEPLV